MNLTLILFFVLAAVAVAAAAGLSDQPQRGLCRPVPRAELRHGGGLLPDPRSAPSSPWRR